MRFAIAALLAAGLLASVFGCASGSVTVTGTRRPAITAAEVRVYADPPVDHEVIALLESAPGRGWTQQSRRDHAIEDLKVKAAELGANGIVITGIGDSGSSSGVGVGAGGGHGGIGIGVSQSAQSMFAKAIWVRSPP